MAKLRYQTFKHQLVISAVVAITLSAGLYGCSADQSAQIIGAQSSVATTIPGPGVTIYAAGDIADCRNRKPADTGAAQTAGLIASGLAADKDATALTLGDNAYLLGLPLDFNDCYDPTWGRFKARTHPSPGNHDYYTPNAIGYYGYFGAAAGPGQRGYYSYDLGEWHVVSLNSNLKKTEHQAQLDWLKNDLDQHQNHCTLAYWHHPLYSSGGHGNNARMRDVWQLLAAANADVVLNGHDHDFERFAPQDSKGQRDDKRGIRQFVVGTGGAELDPIVHAQPNSEARDHSSHGVLKMMLKESGYQWEFLPVEGGKFADSGAALCHRAR